MTPEEVLNKYGKDIARLIDDDNQNTRDKFALQEEVDAVKAEALAAIYRIIEIKDIKTTIRNHKNTIDWLGIQGANPFIANTQDAIKRLEARLQSKLEDK